MTTRTIPRALLAAGAAATLAIAGCSGEAADEAASAASSSASSATDAAKDAAEGPVTLEDAYIKEKGADKEMTAIFGTLVNHTDEDLTITGFSVKGLAEGTEFQQHETADGVMREVEGGLTIPANGSLELGPGGEHLMIMANHDAIEAGAEYELTVELSDGSTLEETIPARVQAAGEEDYDEGGTLQGATTSPAHDGPDMGDMDHSDHSDHSSHSEHSGH